MLNLKEAVDMVYYSYMNAQKYQNYDMPDSEKRNPNITKEWIDKYSQNAHNILVTGSKGKGTVCNILSKLLFMQYTVGLTTSPHIKDFTDRFKIDNNIISEKEFIEIVDTIKLELLELDKTLKQGECISPMGVQAVIALKYFNQNNTDINIFECGKGVKYDDINNVPHTFAILNTIFLEHTRELGNTVLEILQDKLSIVTHDTKYLYVGNISKQSNELVDYIKKYINANYPNCQVKFFGVDFYCNDILINKLGTSFKATIFDKIYNLQIPFFGEHQAENTTLAIAVYLDIVKQHTSENYLTDVLKDISIIGRLQILKKEPLLIVDTCINRESCKQVVDVLEKIYPNKKLNFILCIPDDKDYIGVGEQVSHLSNKIILTKTKNPYYKFSDIQTQNFNKINIDTIYFNDINSALNYCENDDCCILCTTGLLPEIII